MNGFKLRIDNAIANIDAAMEILLSDKARLQSEVERLTAENAKLKDLTRSAVSQLDSYIIELEDIRRKHGGSNGSN